MNKRILIIYHKIDFDGLCSMSIIRRWAAEDGLEADLLPYSYGDPDPVVVPTDYAFIYVADVCLPTPLMLTLEESGRLVWLDHHNTSIEQSVRDGFNLCGGIRQEGTGACDLCWQYFYPDTPTPLAVSLLATYDVSDKERYDWETETLPFQFGLRARYNLDPETFYTYFTEAVEDPGRITPIIQEGRAIIRYARATGRRACDAYAFEVTIGYGIKGLCMLTAHFGCLEMEESMRERGCQVAVCVNLLQSGEYKVSVYAGGNPIGFNLGRYMKEHYQGGGHPCAAGGKLTPRQYKRLIEYKTL